MRKFMVKIAQNLPVKLLKERRLASNFAEVNVHLLGLLN
jgi:hypothetical protein